MNDVCITNGVICMYKTVNLKTKLCTKLTNQNSYDELSMGDRIYIEYNTTR